MHLRGLFFGVFVLLSKKKTIPPYYQIKALKDSLFILSIFGGIEKGKSVRVVCSYNLGTEV